MIVKNEAAVIERCLASVRPLIDCWCIVDTGSGDATCELIESAMQGVPGALHRRPWQDFAHNRNEALALAREVLRAAAADLASDYLLLIDADETLVLPAGFVRPPLTAAAYEFEFRYAQMSYSRTAMVAAAMAWRYRGVLHEYLVCVGNPGVASLPGPYVWVRPEGARSRNPRKFHDDALVLERAVQAEPDNARYWFYLGQSYRDAGEPQQALRAYRQRALLAGWEEENWYTLLQIAQMLELTGADAALVRDAYEAAYLRRPGRAETLVELARWHRQRSEFAQALLYARAAAQLPVPGDRLFVDLAAHGWRALDEWSIAAYYCECYAEGAQALSRLLQVAVPTEQRPRVEANVTYYAAKGFAVVVAAGTPSG